MRGRHTKHNLEPGCGTVGHQIHLAGGGAERGFDIEQAPFWVAAGASVMVPNACLSAWRSAVSISSALVSSLPPAPRDNGGDGTDIAGAVGKQHAVTALEGKWHDARLIGKGIRLF